MFCTLKVTIELSHSKFCTWPITCVAEMVFPEIWWCVILQLYVTHALKVEGLRGIVSVPAKLESTTLVFAYGTDLFFTRLAPSRTYDSLTEDFSYALLLLTIVALVVAIFVTWILSERKELRDKWRWFLSIEYFLKCFLHFLWTVSHF